MQRIGPAQRSAMASSTAQLHRYTGDLGLAFHDPLKPTL
jgi:hypothetical protein